MTKQRRIKKVKADKYLKDKLWVSEGIVCTNLSIDLCTCDHMGIKQWHWGFALKIKVEIEYKIWT